MAQQSFKVGGVSGVSTDLEHFSLADGITLRRTFAHLMSVNLMAFAPAKAGQPHSTPWKAAKGGFGYDIEIEIIVQRAAAEDLRLTMEDTIWLIAALIRLEHPYASIPVLSSRSFSLLASSKEEAELTPFEFEIRLFSPAEKPTLSQEDLAWIKQKLKAVARMLNTNPSFRAALRALDQANIHGRNSASLLATWGALEEIFSPSRNELRFRVSAYLASYLEDPGEARLNLHKELLKLYDRRSEAAHGAKTADITPLVQSFVILRNAIVKMIDNESIPSHKELDQMLFCLSNR